MDLKYFLLWLWFYEKPVSFQNIMSFIFQFTGNSSDTKVTGRKSILNTNNKIFLYLLPRLGWKHLINKKKLVADELEGAKSVMVLISLPFSK